MTGPCRLHGFVEYEDKMYQAGRDIGWREVKGGFSRGHGFAGDRWAAARDKHYARGENVCERFGNWYLQACEAVGAWG